MIFLQIILKVQNNCNYALKRELGGGGGGGGGGGFDFLV